MSAGLDPKRWQDAKRILDEALDRPGPERAEFVARACGGDESLRSEVESLLRSAEAEWTLVDEGEAARAAMFPDAAPRSRIGERIGVYEILSELGRGGMGMVFLARRADDEFQKKVAIKLVRSGMASESSLRRFRSERQISATLDHPNIAKLLDGGTSADGEPYFVMEYVEGETLLDYCEERRLSMRARLELFRQVCAAVQYAHQHLVVHRDIKPSNILVTVEGAPKLLDFGIAKFLEPGEGETAPETGTLFLMMTPEYASPEQVRSQKVSTASDVYSLGIVLYELLAGDKPYRIETGDPQELVRVVCERDPARPSTRAAGISGDLDAIVLKAIRKEPAARYASVEALSEDIGRYLDGRPVLARRGTAAYRVGKFVRRHRVGVVAAALAVLALCGGVWAVLLEARRARLAEARAERRFNDVRRLANSFLFEFHDAIRGLPGSTPARALLVRRALEYLDGLAKESAGDRDLRRELAEAYQRVGDVEGNPYHENLGDLKGALASYEKSIALLEPIVSSGRATDAERSTLAAAYVVGGGIRVVSGDSQAAIAMAGRGLALRRDLADRHPGDPHRAFDLAQAWRIYAFNLSSAGRVPESYEALLKQANILRSLLAATPGDRQIRRDLGQNLYLTGEALKARGDPDGSRKTLQEAVSVDESLLREDPASVQLRRDLAWTRMGLGRFYSDAHDPRSAITEYGIAQSLFEWIVSADPKNTDGRLGVGLTHHNVGLARRATDGPEAALRDYERARAFYRPVQEADPSNVFLQALLAQLDLDSGEATEELARSSPSGRPGSSDSACRFYSSSAAGFGRLKAAGRLNSERTEAAERAARALERCRSASPAR